MAEHRTDADVIVIGAGIVGLATALAVLERNPSMTVMVIEQESGPAVHQSGRNSGVIHAGLYYRPGSLKARLCAEGRDAMFAFADANGIGVKRSGKVVVAVRETERERLIELYERGRAHGLAVELLDSAGVREHEPHAAAVGGIWVPETGVVDFVGVCRQMVADLRTAGQSVQFGTKITRIVQDDSRTPVRVLSHENEFRAKTVINCGGLWADRLVQTDHADSSRPHSSSEDRVSIIPFRGEYRTVVGESAELVRTMLYPVPDPRFPFLGVHLTRGHDETVHAGPNAVLALARDGYSWSRIQPRDVFEMARDPATWRLARRHWRTGIDEVRRSLSQRRYLESLRQLVPSIRECDVVSAPSGVRAQAVDSQGGLLDDFVLQRSGNVVHVLNAPSPAATASLAIGRHIASRL